MSSPRDKTVHPLTSELFTKTVWWLDARTRFETSWLIVRDDLGAGDGPPEVLTLGAGGGVEGDGTRSCPSSVSRRRRCSSCACAGSGAGGTPARAGLRTSPRFSLTPARRSGASPSTRSPRSAPTGRTTSSACRERSSSGCSPPDDDASHGPPRRHLRRVTPTLAGRT